jgi:hypothetical protein
LPIAFYVVPRELIIALWPSSLPDVSKLIGSAPSKNSVEEIVGQILARALLVIPGLMLVRFASSRHERLFRLREHYAYKYSIASSVEGFKKQAEGYDKEIAATACYELTFNPATRMDEKSSDTRHPNPAMEWLLRRMEGRSVKTSAE